MKPAKASNSNLLTINERHPPPMWVRRSALAQIAEMIFQGRPLAFARRSACLDKTSEFLCSDIIVPPFGPPERRGPDERDVRPFKFITDDSKKDLKASDPPLLKRHNLKYVSWD
jgi:hypothetical protein